MNLKFQNLQPDARAALFSITFFWAFYFAITTLRSFVSDYPDPMLMIPRRAGVVLVGAAITWIIFLVLRPFEKQTLSVRMAAHFLAAIPAAAAYGAVNHFFFYILSPLPMLGEPGEGKMKGINAAHMILESAISWYWFFSAWAAFYLALRYAAEVRTAERRAAAWRTEAQSAQLRALRYQVNPHFLFNTLNSISTMILKKRNVEAEQMVLNLSTFLRTSLSGDPETLVPLSEEVEQQRLYLDVERVRFRDRLNVEINVAPDAGRSFVPPMILQPIIENAVKYAVSPAKTRVTIRLKALRVGDRLHIRIADDGPGVPPPFESGLGTGLANVRDRIRTHFGNDATFSAGPGENGGFVVDMSWIPGRRYVP
ncbi:histidine kinase [Pacificimonas sp. WHA3]|uniref:Histidine kinase n=1 Tax=Pacificimonas pallii TaxID=2827236 RepID=A0ABS6SFI9_9SPHN|nr:histidine kinase [Pacificimonas pallii]MBV7257167.1 histidine kinase [Pacificimonas pallii]